LSAATNALSFGTQNPEENKKRDLIREALDVIAAQHNEADLSLVRRVLDAQGISPTHTVIAYLKALGSPDDVLRLAQTARYLWFHYVAGDDIERDFNAAAQAILSLTSGHFNGLLTLAIPEQMRARLIDLASPTEFAKLHIGVIVNLLLSDDTAVRRATAKKVPGCLTRARIAKVLSAYRANEKGVYYLVIYWLDLGLAYSRPMSRQVAAHMR
jgi:hypothetical protein